MGLRVLFAWFAGIAIIGAGVAATPASLAASSVPVPRQTVPAVVSLIGNVSLDRLYDDLYHLQNFSTRFSYSAGAVAAGQYIYDSFAANPALQVSFQDFTVGGTPMRNVVAVLPGLDPTNDTVYVVGGHYDSTSNTPMVSAPGADDDGSGTAATLEAARVLGRHRYNATLMFAAWEGEEQGLLGSAYCARCMASYGDRVGLYVNMDMIGYDATGGNGLIVVTNPESQWAADRFDATVADYGIGLASTVVVSAMANSDHYSFWTQGYPAIFLFEETFTPFYHSTADLIGTLSMNLVRNTTQGAVATVAELAGVLPLGPGSLFLDRAAYGLAGRPAVTLYDADRNQNPATRETAAVTLASPSEPGGEALTLTETGPDTAVFTGSLPLGTAAGMPGELRVAAGETITATYQDASPPTTVTVIATIDGTVPVIGNVAAVPSLVGAEVSWATNKPADATVSFGTTPALGTNVTDTVLATQHAVALTDLVPDTTYYFDVASTDAAGQTVTADNGGAHFRFHTLTGAVARPPQGRMGYVRSDDPGGNSLGADAMHSGYSAVTGRTYYGMAQFDTTSAAIPPAVAVTGVGIELYGQVWQYEGPGTWAVQLLNASLDGGWTGHGYTAIATAPVDLTIPPTFSEADLAPGVWETVRFPAATLPAVRDRVNTGALSIRIDGPTGPVGSLFDFATGYPADCPGLPSRVPRLLVSYSGTGDATGPVVTDLATAPDPSMASPVVMVSATVSDAATGGTPIASAELFLGPDPGPGLGIPMTAADGSFDTATEGATHLIDVSALPRGVYTVGVRGQDRAGNWGAPRTHDFRVGVWDLYPPTVTATAAPDPATVGATVTITANATDDVGVVRVWANLTDPGGAPAGNRTMARAGPDWADAAAYSVAGTWTYVVWANDSSGKWGNASGSFVILARTPPTIAAVASPNPAEVPADVNITATVTDADGLAAVAVAVTDPGGLALNVSMSRSGASAWYAHRYTLLGTYAFRVWASDAQGTWAHADGTFVVQDTTPPEVAAEASPPSVAVRGVVRIEASASDNDRVDRVDVEVLAPGGASLGSRRMAYDPGLQRYVLDVNAREAGTYTFVVTATDASGHQATASGTFSAAAPAGIPAELLALVILLPVVVAVLVILVVLWRRRRKSGAPSEGPPPGEP